MQGAELRVFLGGRLRGGLSPAPGVEHSDARLIPRLHIFSEILTAPAKQWEPGKKGILRSRIVATLERDAPSLCPSGLDICWDENRTIRGSRHKEGQMIAAIGGFHARGSQCCDPITRTTSSGRAAPPRVSFESGAEEGGIGKDCRGGLSVGTRVTAAVNDCLLAPLCPRCPTYAETAPRFPCL